MGRPQRKLVDDGVYHAILVIMDPLYIEMGKTKKKRMRLYREYVLQSRPYEQILDKKLKI